MITVNQHLFVGLLFSCAILIPILAVALIRNKRALIITTLIFMVLYLGILMVGVLGSLSLKNGNIIIKMSFNYHSKKSIHWALSTPIRDAVKNILMFIPFGVGGYVVLKLKGEKTYKILILLLIAGASFGIVIESLQYFLPINRMVQFIDVINNGLSCLLGGIISHICYLIGKLFRRKKPQI